MLSVDIGQRRCSRVSGVHFRRQVSQRLQGGYRIFLLYGAKGKALNRLQQGMVFIGS
jgi:hypothetical protein